MIFNYRLALLASLLMHGLIFAFSGRTFIQHAQFSVQPSVQMVEVSIKEIKDVKDNLQDGDMPIKAIEKINKTKANRFKEAAHSKSGIKIKANPDYFQNPPPEYPELAKQMHQEGVVMLSVDVDKEGVPMSVEIIQSSRYDMLDQAALKAVRHWKFQPGSIGGIPVDSTVTIPIRFRLEK